ncbi:hypothetical protein BV379_09090 [Rhodovulum sulfidophilum]|nr:hypothetical protein BV379_09090 [Rhodovulum sulfidophilum]
MLSELLDKIPPEQEIGSVTADGAYDRRGHGCDEDCWLWRSRRAAESGSARDAGSRPFPGRQDRIRPVGPGARWRRARP